MYAVLGNPISHSLSPRIFKLFAGQFNHTIHYQALPVTPEDLAPELRRLHCLGYQGVNLTTPLKEAALPLAQTLSAAARAAGALNILSIHPDGSYHGHNSDGLGFVRDLQRKQVAIQGQSILILGAGGAARGLLPSLLDESPAQIQIYNRSEQKAQQLSEVFRDKPTPVTVSSWPDLQLHRFDLIINCTTLGLQGEKLPFPREILNPEACCYDLSYGRAAHPFLTWSREQGARHCHDGLGMLVEQAAEAFYLWENRRVNTEAILQNISPSP